MTLLGGEQRAPGGVVDPDGRQVVVVDGTVTTSGVAAAVAAVTAISAAGYDLQAAPFLATSALPNDFVLNKIEFAFSTTASRTITVTRSDGSVLFSDTDTNVQVELENIDEAITGANNFTVAITQTGSACLVTLRAVVLTSAVALGGGTTAVSQSGAWNVGLNAGTNQIGSVTQAAGPWETSVQHAVDLNNTTTTPLSAGATFTGTATDLFASNVASITYNVFADPDQMTTSPVLTFQFSPDGTNWDVQVPATVGNGHIFIPVPLRPVERYFRILYTNGSTNQTAFRLTTYLHSAVVEPLARSGVQSIGPYDPTTVVRALVEPSFKGHLSLLGADRSIGGEAIVFPYMVQDKAQFDVPLANNNVTATTSGGATAAQASATGLTLTSANAAGASSANVAGTKKVRYSPGRETRMELTAAFSAPLAGSDVLVGLSDTPAAPLTGNGVLVGYNGTTFGLHIVSGGSLTTVPRAAWNGDSFDGSALSEFRSNNVSQALDVTKANAYRIRYVWYGIGPVYLEVRSPDDRWIVAHTLHYPNTATVPYIQNPNVFMCWDVTKLGGAGAGTLTLRSFSASAGTVEPEINFEPHEVHGHKQIQQAVTNQGASVAPVYTVGTGRQLLVKTIYANLLTVSQAAGNRLEIWDGTAGSGILLFALTAQRANNNMITQSVSLPVPLIFLTNVTANLVVAGGSLVFDFGITGYEKEA